MEFSNNNNNSEMGSSSSAPESEEKALDLFHEWNNIILVWDLSAFFSPQNTPSNTNTNNNTLNQEQINNDNNTNSLHKTSKSSESLSPVCVVGLKERVSCLCFSPSESTHLYAGTHDGAVILFSLAAGYENNNNRNNNNNSSEEKNREIEKENSSSLQSDTQRDTKTDFSHIHSSSVNNTDNNTSITSHTLNTQSINAQSLNIHNTSPNSDSRITHSPIRTSSLVLGEELVRGEAEEHAGRRILSFAAAQPHQAWKIVSVDLLGTRVWWSDNLAAPLRVFSFLTHTRDAARAYSAKGPIEIALSSFAFVRGSSQNASNSHVTQNKYTERLADVFLYGLEDGRLRRGVEKDSVPHLVYPAQDDDSAIEQSVQTILTRNNTHTKNERNISIQGEISSSSSSSSSINNSSTFNLNLNNNNNNTNNSNTNKDSNNEQMQPLLDIPLPVTALAVHPLCLDTAWAEDTHSLFFDDDDENENMKNGNDDTSVNHKNLSSSSSNNNLNTAESSSSLNRPLTKQQKRFLSSRLLFAYSSGAGRIHVACGPSVDCTAALRSETAHNYASTELFPPLSLCAYIPSQAHLLYNPPVQKSNPKAFFMGMLGARPGLTQKRRQQPVHTQNNNNTQETNQNSEGGLFRREERDAPVLDESADGDEESTLDDTGDAECVHLPVHVSALAWSPVHPGVLAVAASHGTVHLFHISAHAASQLAVFATPPRVPLTSLHWHPHGHSLIAGDVYGCLYVFRVSQSLYSLTKTQKENIFWRMLEPLYSERSNERQS